MNLRRVWILTILFLATPTVSGLAQVGHTERGGFTFPRIVAEPGGNTNLVLELTSGEKATDEKRLVTNEKSKKEPAKQLDKKKHARPSLEDPDPDVRLKAVEALTDQTILAKVAKNDSSHFVRWSAVDRLTDQDALAEVASTDSNEMVRLRAVHRLTDPRALGAAAKGARDKGTVKAVLGKLRDTDMLISLARNRSNQMLSRGATLRLMELEGMSSWLPPHHQKKAVDLQIALHDSDESIRFLAVHRLSDPKLLEKLSANTSCPKVALAALNKRWELSREKPKPRKRITRHQGTPEQTDVTGSATNVAVAGREEKSSRGDYLMGIVASVSELYEIERNLSSEVGRRRREAGEFSSTGVVFAHCKCRDQGKIAYGYSTAFTYDKGMAGFCMELAKELHEFAKRNSGGCTAVTSRVIE